MSNKINQLSAPTLRLILIFSMGLLVILTGFGFLYFRQQLVDYSAKVNADSAAASASADEVATLKRLKTELEDDKVSVTRAANIVADSKSYQYQNQIIDDITTYANQANITIAGFNFDSGSSTSSTSSAAASTPAPTAANSGPPSTMSIGSSAPAPTVSLKSTNVSIDIENPVSYKAFMTFIHSIESNLTKMVITGVSLSPNQTSPGKVDVNTIEIKVYTR